MARLSNYLRSRRETDCPQFTRGRVCSLKSLVGDPKSVDLCVGRLKPGETRVEDRTSTDVQIVWITCV